MNFKKLMLIAGPLLFNKGCFPEEKNNSHQVPSFEEHNKKEQFQHTHVNEYCFMPSRSLSLSIQRAQITPYEFLRNNDNVEAVINGVYYGVDSTPLGIAYAEGAEHANGNKNQVRGYFTIDNAGKIMVTKSLQNHKEDYAVVIGTHPLLITSNDVDPQAIEKRYNGRPAYRSAIGTKGSDVCFAVSTNSLEMQVWAEVLQDAGYTGALNLDGGPISQLAVRRKEGIDLYGLGLEQTRIVIFSHQNK